MKPRKPLLALLPFAALALCSFLASGQSAPPPKSKAEQDAINVMVTSADKLDKYLDEIEDIRAKTPEFIALRLTSQKRLLIARLLQQPEPNARRKLIDNYIARLTLQKDLAASTTDGAPRYMVPPFAYALAEAEYVKANGKWPSAGHLLSN